MAQRRTIRPLVPAAAASLAVIALVGLQPRAPSGEMVAAAQAEAAPEATGPLRPSYVVRYPPPVSDAPSKPQPAQVSLSVQPLATPEPPAPGTAREKLYVAAGALNVRAGPSSGSPQLAALPFGTKVEVLGSDGNWLEVNAGDVHGWVFAKYLSPTAPR